MEATRDYNLIMGTFSTTDEEPDFYVEGCESVERWENDPERKDRFAAFREELATHIRDSSDRPLGEHESQWRNDEWLRNLWYDLFGPDPAPGDPYPVPARDWGLRRATPYMEYGVGESDEDSTEAERAWLAARGLSREQIRLGSSARPEPGDYRQRLDRLVEEGRRP